MNLALELSGSLHADVGLGDLGERYREEYRRFHGVCHSVPWVRKIRGGAWILCPHPSSPGRDLGTIATSKPQTAIGIPTHLLNSPLCPRGTRCCFTKNTTATLVLRGRASHRPMVAARFALRPLLPDFVPEAQALLRAARGLRYRVSALGPTALGGDRHVPNRRH